MRLATTSRPPAPCRLVVDSPIGPLSLEGNDGSVTHLYLPSARAATAGPAGTAGTAGTSSGPVPAPLLRAARQLGEYFAGGRTAFDLPLELVGTPFQRSVWLALAAIPYGKTVSYADLAGRVGRPAAFRAVGQANGANPLPIFYPCHRVIASGGGLGGYGGGLDVKRRLLTLEGWSGTVTAAGTSRSSPTQLPW